MVTYVAGSVDEHVFTNSANGCNYCHCINVASAADFCSRCDNRGRVDQWVGGVELMLYCQLNQLFASGGAEGSGHKRAVLVSGTQVLQFGDWLFLDKPGLISINLNGVFDREIKAQATFQIVINQGCTNPEQAN